MFDPRLDSHVRSNLNCLETKNLQVVKVVKEKGLELFTDSKRKSY